MTKRANHSGGALFPANKKRGAHSEEQNPAIPNKIIIVFGGLVKWKKTRLLCER